MTTTNPSKNINTSGEDEISFKLVSELIRSRIQADKARFHANDNISEYIFPGELETLEKQVEKYNNWEPLLLSKDDIKEEIPKILDWIEATSKKPNYYLWGGTFGPNFDCSGLIQTAFSSENIWIPRDAYQQEIFCNPVIFNKNTFEELVAGDLLFLRIKRP